MTIVFGLAGCFLIFSFCSEKPLEIIVASFYRMDTCPICQFHGTQSTDQLEKASLQSLSFFSAADSCAFHLFHFNDISTLLYLTYILLHRYIVKERTHPFNGPLSGTTRVIRYQKGKTNLDFTEARDSEWQWHPLDHMQVCTSLLADNHASTPPLIFYRVDALPDTWYIVKEQGCNLLMFVWCLFLLLYSYCLY